MPYATFFKESPAYAPASGSTNAYDDYLLIGAEAAKVLVEPQTATFSPGYREITCKRAAPLLAKLDAATRKQCTVQFRARQLASTGDAGGGWSRLGRALAWTISAAAADQDWKSVVRWTRVGLAFGMDLNGGGASEGSVGLVVADQVRDAAAKSLPLVPATELDQLARDGRAALLRLPTVEQTLANERQSELAAIQALQDAYRDRKSGSLDQVGKQVYRDAREAVSYLRSMSEAERPRYFEGLSQEVEALHKQALFADQPAPVGEPVASKQAYRPWKRLIPHLFGSARPYLQMRTLTLARTRMFVLSAMAHSGVRKHGAAPDVLEQLAGDVTIDPYSGRRFGFAKAGPDFNVFSVGADGRDDAGETDNRGLSPDVRLLGSASGG